MTNFCSTCGRKNYDLNNEQCAGCGAPFQADLTATNNDENIVYVKKKSVFASFIISFFLPGSAQVYHGDLKRGLIILAGFYIGLLLFIIPGIIVWVYALYDAVVGARNINEGVTPFVEPPAEYAVVFVIIDWVLFFIFLVIAIIAWFAMLFALI